MGAPGEEEPPERETDEPDRDVDEEDEPPAAERGERSAEHRPEGETDGLRGTLDAEPSPEPRGRQHVTDERVRVRLQHHGADRLDEPSGNQQPERWGDSAGSGADHEDAEAVCVEELAADPIGQLAHGRDSPRKNQDVDEHDPLDRSDRRVQVGSEDGQRRRDDARVELAHEGTDADGADGKPGRRRQCADPGGAARLGEDSRRRPPWDLRLRHGCQEPLRRVLRPPCPHIIRHGPACRPRRHGECRWAVTERWSLSSLASAARYWGDHLSTRPGGRTRWPSSASFSSMTNRDCCM